ncbi:hypothetical protein HPULCUR_004127 [Helicostylum pulchrum]|uniref:Uncharacterized protein n=1 Tax=Helicostylum pulchrum TaxID=562976 RepID=A0ABP9XVA7_9FUNG
MPQTDTEQHNVDDLTDQDSPVGYSSMGVYTAPPTSPGNSSLVLDLTADELNFINDVNDPAQSGSSTRNDTALDDDAFAFFVEAGLDDPEELSMLGIDIEEIRSQRAIAERLEQQRRADLEAVRQLQEEEEREQQQQQQQQYQRLTEERLREERIKEERLINLQEQNNLPLVVAESSSGRSSDLNQLSTSNNDQGSSRSRGKRRTEHDTSDENKRAKVEVEVKPIELIDDDDCIDLTSEIEGTSYGPIRIDDIDEASSSRPRTINPIEVPSSGPTPRISEIYDIDSDSDHDAPLDYLSFANYIRRNQDDSDLEGLDYEDNDQYLRDPFTSRETGEFYDDFGDDSTLINILGRTGYTFTEGQGNFQRPRAPPPIMNYPSQRQTPQEAERELRDLLEHVIFDEPPPPEDRTGTPDGLSIVLMEHQKIGLQWMLKMENSRNKGGILADDMGLGKTIQAMAVIVQNTCDDYTPVDHSLINGTGSRLTAGELHIKATLIVCPVSLIDQWRREIESKTSPKLSVLVYHGGTRTQNPYDLARYDVIVSSYAITASNFQENHKGPFSKVTFHRVILDEAHTIKNKTTRAAVGCCSLLATYRWCMTATPIQNKIEELYSLIRFLRIRPFCEWEEFRDCIAKPMKAGNHEKAIRVAQVLMKAISLRRSKKALIDGRPILNLPARNVHMTHIDFTSDERTHYDYVNQTAQARFNRYMAAGTVMKNYSSVLVLLLRLRQACLHPSLTLQEGDSTGVVMQEPENLMQLAESMRPEVVARLLDDSAGLAEIECPVCMDIAQDAQIIVGCGHILCKECFDGYWNVGDGNTKRCPQCRGELNISKLVTVEVFLQKHAPQLLEQALAPISETEQQDINRVQEFISSAKIDKMMELLEQTERDTDGKDKTIVFSQFTGLLNLVEVPLKEKGMAFLRYDGSMDVRHRAEAVNQFFDNPNIKILLVSTKCGSLGLNLTVANRVILLDVWWNPALENQAIDRVHRIGQTKDVEVHRIFINDTVEDRILELQSKKQAISDGVLGEGTGQPTQRLGLQEMIYLFRGGAPPNPNAGPSNAGPSNASPSNAGPSNARPSNPQPSNPQPSNTSFVNVNPFNANNNSFPGRPGPRRTAARHPAAHSRQRPNTR